MDLKIYQVDAFTDEVFGGNPAAVIPLNHWLSVDLMQAIAAENNLSETAFFVPSDDGFDLRWFTPEVEVDLCGHATLAVAHVLFRHENYNEETINFDTKSGELIVNRTGKYLTMNFPATIPEKVDPPSGLLDALGVLSNEIYFKSDYLVLVESETELKILKPDFSKLKKIDTRGVIVTAPGSDYDFVSRFFAPAVGINEDPVTGSAHTMLTPFWSNRLGKSSFKAAQLSKRGGSLQCNLKGGRVELTGEAVTFFAGMIYLEG
ncbi:MAG: PhzF family phenazine biosynthesis protein [Balneolaceae bacterium]